MTSTLPHFWQLASSSKSDRLRSAHGLIQTLTSSSNGPAAAAAAQDNDVQTGPSSQHLFDDGLNASRADWKDDYINEQQLQQAEQALAQAGSNDLAYAVKRLIKGLASHRESSRLGFSVALCELLARTHDIEAQFILTLIFGYSQPNGGKFGGANVKGQEERDLLYARLFGIHALVRSGMLVRTHSSSQQNVTRALKMLLTLSKGKPWLRESAASVTVQLVQVLGQIDAKAQWPDECMRWLMEQTCSEKPITADTVAVFVALRQHARDGLFSKAQRLPHFASQDILASANLPILARLLRDASVHDGEDVTLANESAGSASGSPHAHFLWDMILQRFSAAHSTQPDANTASFADVFRALVDENLFIPTSSHQKKSWGFQVWEKAARVVRPEFVSSIFTPNLMRTLMNQLSGKDRMLHKLAQKACLGMQDVAKQRNDVAYSIVMQLTGGNGSVRFDTLTNSKTVESILRTLSEEEVTKYAAHLISLSCKDVGESVRKSLFDQLLVLVRNANIETDDECVEDILAFFVSHGLYVVKKAIKSGVRPSSLGIMPSPPFSASLQESCRSRFLSCLGDLHERGNADWIKRGYAIMKQLEQDSKHFERLDQEQPSKVMQNADAKIQKLQRELSKEKNARQEAFTNLLTACLLFLQCTGANEEDKEELLEPLLDCSDRLLRASGLPTNGEPGPMELFVDCLSNALQPASSFLRGVVTSAFDAFADQMTFASMRLLLEQLGFDSQKSQQDDEGMDVEEDAMRSQDPSDAESDTSDASSASDKNDEEEMAEEVDADFAAKIREALQSGGVADDDDGGEEHGEEDDDKSSDAFDSDLNDDQMLLIDDKLADIFRQKFSARKKEEASKKEEIAYHTRIIDLLEHFARSQPSNALCIEMVLPLFSITMEKAEKELEPLRQRATNVLQRTLFKQKVAPVGVSADKVAEALDAVHKLACANLTGAQLTLANSANVYLTRCCEASADDTAKGSVPERVCQVYEATLKDFMQRKANNLKPSFLIDAFTRFPRLGFAVRQTLLSSASGEQISMQHSFRQVQVMEMLRTVLTQIVAQMTSAESSNEKGDDAQTDALLGQVAMLTLKRVQNDHLRLKEIIKIGLHFVRLTNKLREQREKSNALMAKIWPPEEVEAAKEALETLSEKNVPNATSLQNLFKQLSTLTQKGTGASDGNRSTSSSSSSKKRLQNEKSTESAPNAAKSKKSRKA